ncbi:hypothetical protein HYV84_07200 [Candidatus Woesearchaeota archaeon]|nr:hypothetical protein [Candidatus Woesearchaeota archaeon]
MLQLKQVAGKVTLLRGDSSTLFTLLMSAAAKLQNISKVLFVDSANCFNPYLLKKLSPRNILPILRNILIARPFNAYQLKEIVLRLEKSIQETKSRALIISSIDVFHDDVTSEEAPFLFSLVLNEIRSLTRKYRLVTLVGSTKSEKAAQQVATLVHKKIDQSYVV